MVKGAGTLVCGVAPSQSLPPALGAGIWHPGLSAPLVLARSLARISREAHFQVRISFVQFSPTRISFFEAHCCMRAGLMLTHQSHLFCLSKSMSEPHGPCIFFLTALTRYLSPYEKGLHLLLFILLCFFFFCSRTVSNSISLNFCKHF